MSDKVYSSTSLKYFTDYCPAALGFYEKDTPYVRDHFQAGVAAHAVLQEVGERGAATEEETKAVAEAVTEELIKKGRAFNKKPEPPMAPDAAFEGRGIALKYLANDTLPEGAKYEIGLAMDATGKLCDYYDDKARYRAIIDRTYQQEAGDEEWSGKLIVAGDYKSAWPTDAKELETLQRKGQAVLVSKGADFSLQGLRLEVVNLRTFKSFYKDMWFDGETLDTLKQWESDILMLCRAADETREPRPGASCIDCPFAYACDACLQVRVGTLEDEAEMLALLEANRKLLIKELKSCLVEVDRFNVNGGYVGYKAEKKMAPTDDAIYNIIAWWYGAHKEEKQSREEISQEYPLEVGLLTALGIGSGQVNSLAKTLFDKTDKEKKAEFLDKCLVDVGALKFGVWKEKGGK